MFEILKIKLKSKCNCTTMKTIQDIKDELTAIQQSLTVAQADLQAIQDGTPVPVPDIPKITIPLNTPVELVTE